MTNVSATKLHILIPSTTVREFVINTGYQFTDKQQAAMIYNQDFAYQDLHDLLMKIHDNTEDEMLKKEIRECIEFEENDVKQFRDNSENKYIYLLKIYDPDDEESYDAGYFINVDDAIIHGVQFNIVKWRLYKTYQESMEADYGTGVMRYGQNGELLSCWVAGDCPFKNNPTHFTQMFYEVPNPFTKGDLIKCIDTGTYGVVEETREEWMEKVKKAKDQISKYDPNKIIPGQLDHMDVNIKVTVFHEDSVSLTHRDINPIYLERYFPDKSPEDTKDRDQLLYAISDLYKGDGSITDIIFYLDNY